MGMQKYRADVCDPKDENGGTAWFARWMGGPSLALVRCCATPFGPRTVYVTGEPDTWFSVPAACVYRRHRISGWLERTEQGYVFHPHNGPWVKTVYPWADEHGTEVAQ